MAVGSTFHRIRVVLECVNIWIGKCGVDSNWKLLIVVLDFIWMVWDIMCLLLPLIKKRLECQQVAFILNYLFFLFCSLVIYRIYGTKIPGAVGNVLLFPICYIIFRVESEMEL